MKLKIGTRVKLKNPVAEYECGLFEITKSSGGIVTINQVSSRTGRVKKSGISMTFDPTANPLTVVKE